MKRRHGHVSNSSSSSFVIDKDKITPEQLDQIRNHREYAKDKMWNDLGLYSHVIFGVPVEFLNTWDVREITGAVEVSTSMDNFDMREFVRRISVPDSAISQYWHSNG